MIEIEITTVSSRYLFSSAFDRKYINLWRHGRKEEKAFFTITINLNFLPKSEINNDQTAVLYLIRYVIFKKI